LNQNQKQKLDFLLQDFEKKTSSQIFVGIFDKIPANDSLEGYVNELFTRWNPGKKDRDNGALLAIFVKDRKLRIEVGYGLEPKLTDAASKLIIQNDIVPAFKQGNYFSGIQAGLHSIVLKLNKDYIMPSGSTASRKDTRPAPESGLPFNSAFILLLVVFALIALFIRAKKGGTRRNQEWNSSSRGWERISRAPTRRIRLVRNTKLGGLPLLVGRRSPAAPSSISFSDFSGGSGGLSGGGGASGSW
jgi:uncharacterized protein